mgnify:CR=1 FL=1
MLSFSCMSASLFLSKARCFFSHVITFFPPDIFFSMKKDTILIFFNQQIMILIMLFIKKRIKYVKFRLNSHLVV